MTYEVWRVAGVLVLVKPGDPKPEGEFLGVLADTKEKK